MKEFIGKNPDFKVIWDCNAQEYIVYYKGKFVVKKYKFSDVKSYLD